MRTAVANYVLFFAAAALSATASAKDPPSSSELLVWVTCLKLTGFDPLSGHGSNEGLEAAFTNCSLQENSLRQAISRDPSHFPEYNVESMKNVLRAQQEVPKK